MHKALHPRDDVDRQYVSRKEGGRGLANIENSVDASIQRLEEYIENNQKIKNRKKNVLSDLQATSHTRKCGRG